MAPSAKNDPEPPACFPACRNEELVEVLGSLGLVISIEDIAKPQAHVVQRIFATFLEALAGTTPYSLERPKHAALAQMEYRVSYRMHLWMVHWGKFCRRRFARDHGPTPWCRI